MSTRSTSRPGSRYADAVAARRALEMALPMIEAAMRDDSVCGSGFLCIVVMDPAIGPADASFDEAVLLEHAIGDRTRWDADFAALARAKAELSWRHSMDSQAVHHTRAHALREGDSTLWGSVCLDGIVVGVSGAHPWYDEAFATCIAGCLRAVAKERLAAAVAARQLSVPREIPAA